MFVFLFQFIFGEIIVIPIAMNVTFSGTGEITRELVQNYPYDLWESIIIESGPTSIGGGSFMECRLVKYLIISESIKNINFLDGSTFRYMNNLNRIDVAPNNEMFSSDDQGILYNKNKTILYRAPNIEKINIPSTVSVLYNQCFQCNTKVKSLLIPNSVTKIHRGFIYDIFHNPDNLTFESGSTINEFEDQSFAYQNFKLIIVPRSVTILHKNSFLHAKNNEIRFEEGSLLETISENCFNGGLFEALYFPDGLKSINSESFTNCNNLHKIRIPSSTTFIHQNAFSGCVKLATIIVEVGNENYTMYNGSLFSKDKKQLIIAPSQAQTVKIPKETESVGRTALQGCVMASEIEIEPGNNFLEERNGVLYSKGLLKCIAVTGGREKVEIEENCTEIGDFAMYGCVKAKSFMMKGDKITKVGSHSFYNCQCFSELLDLKNVEEINTYAFYKTKNICSVTFSGSKINRINNHAFAQSSIKCMILSKSICCLYEYTFQASDLELFEYPIDSYMDRLGSNIFSSASKLKTIKISSNISTIEEKCFKGCISLRSVDFTHANSLISIGSDAFNGCPIVGELRFSSRIEFLGSSAFKNCNITKIIFPSGSNLKTIKGGCFGYCSSLEYFEISDNVTNINPSIIEGCTSLININLSSNNVNFRIEEGILYDKDWKLVLYPNGKTEGYLSENMTSIENNVFYKQSKLEKLTIRSNNKLFKSIRSNTIVECAKLKEVVFNKHIESIENGWIKDSYMIEAIIFPKESKIKKLVKSQFESIATLRIFKMGEGSLIENISERSFFGCKSLETVEVSESLRVLESSSFEGCVKLSEFKFRKKQNQTDQVNQLIIQNRAFYGCKSLRIFEFERAKSVGDEGFKGSGIENITFSHNIEHLGDSAFFNFNDITCVFINDMK